MLDRYRAVLSLPGAVAFSVAGLVARLPLSMVSLGIVLLVSTRTGSYSLAGAVSAAYIAANAVFAVYLARLVDRLGQHRVLPWCVGAFALLTSGLVWSVEAGWPTPWPHVLAALAGASFPQVGASVRARWSHVTPDKVRLQTAFAIEAVNDELVFIVGPTLVTLLATGVHPVAGLLAAVVAALAGTLALTLQRSSEPPAAGRRASGRPAETLGWRSVAPVVACAVALGVLFGGTEVATVAFSEEAGHKSYSGPLLAIWALGSLISGLVTGAVHLRSGNATRFRVALLALSLLMLPLPFLEGFGLLGVVLFLAGFAISPTLIAAVSLIEESVPTSRLTEGITLFTTGLVTGVAPGAAAVGYVVDRHGASASYWVPAAAGLVGSALAFAAVRDRARRTLG